MRSLVGVAVALLASGAASLAQGPAPGPGRGGGQPVQPIQMVKPGLYVVPGGGSNSIVRVTPEGVILVDTKLPGAANYDGLLAQIRSVTPQPVRIVIVTHHHADQVRKQRQCVQFEAERACEAAEELLAVLNPDPIDKHHQTEGA